MHEAALARAACCEPPVVMGMLLRPLSIGHVLRFHAAGIIDDIGYAGIKPENLTAAVLICCQSWSQSSAMRQDWLLGFKLWLWRRRVAALSKAALKATPGRPYIVQEADKFNAYLRDGSAELPISDTPRAGKQESTRSMGSPYLLRLQQWVMTTLGLDEAAAWDYPFGLAKMRWAVYFEEKGALDIYNEADESFDRYIAEHEAKGASALEKNQEVNRA